MFALFDYDRFEINIFIFEINLFLIETGSNNGILNSFIKNRD
jgi:hypothetical protein